MKAVLLGFVRLAGMQVAIASAGLIRNKVLALRLGPDGFGEYTQLVVAVSVIYGLARLGLVVGLTRFVAAAASAEERQRALSTAVAMTLTATVLLWLAVPVGLYAGWFDGLLTGLEPTPLLIGAGLLLLAITPVDALQGVFLAFLEGNMAFKAVSGSRSLGVLAGTLVSVPIVWYLGFLGGAIQIVLTSVFLTWLLYRRCCELGFRPLLWGVDWQLVRGMGLLGGASLLAGFAQSLSDLGSRSALAAFANMGELGLYQSAVVLTGQLKNAVMNGVNGYALAFLSRRQDDSEASASTSLVLRVAVPFAALPMAGLAVLTVPSLYLLYSESFVAAAIYFPALLVADFLQILAGVFGAPLLGRQRVGLWTGLEVSHHLLRWLLVVALLPALGVQGIVIGNLIAMLVRVVFSWYLYRQVLTLELESGLAGQAAAGLLLISLVGWLSIGSGWGLAGQVAGATATAGYGWWVVHRLVGWRRALDRLRGLIRRGGSG